MMMIDMPNTEHENTDRVKMSISQSKEWGALPGEPNVKMEWKKLEKKIKDSNIKNK